MGLKGEYGFEQDQLDTMQIGKIIIDFHRMAVLIGNWMSTRSTTHSLPLIHTPILDIFLKHTLKRFSSLSTLLLQPSSITDLSQGKLYYLPTLFTFIPGPSNTLPVLRQFTFQREKKKIQKPIIFISTNYYCFCFYISTRIISI